jgi:hypothetical protein
MSIDQDALQQLMVRAVTDMGATLHSVLVLIGEKLGLYKALRLWRSTGHYFR